MFSIRSNLGSEPVEILAPSGQATVRVRNVGGIAAYLGGPDGQHWPIEARHELELAIEGPLFGRADGPTTIVVLGAGSLG